MGMAVLWTHVLVQRWRRRTNEDWGTKESARVKVVASSSKMEAISLACGTGTRWWTGPPLESRSFDPVVRRVLIHFVRQVLARRQMFETEKRIPMAGPASAGVVLDNFNFPKSFAGRGRSGQHSARRPEKYVLFLLVFVHRQEFILFRVEETDNVAAFQDVVQILSMVHEKRNLQRRRGIDDVDFFAAVIVPHFVVGRHVKLAPSVDRTEDDFVAQDRVSMGT